jgi:hypothetical protein
MKVRITFDIDERDRLLIGAKIHGTMTPATHAEVTNTIINEVDNLMRHDRDIWDEHTAEVLKQLGIKGK